MKIQVEERLYSTVNHGCDGDGVVTQKTVSVSLNRGENVGE